MLQLDPDVINGFLTIIIALFIAGWSFFVVEGVISRLRGGTARERSKPLHESLYWATITLTTIGCARPAAPNALQP